MRLIFVGREVGVGVASNFLLCNAHLGPNRLGTKIEALGATAMTSTPDKEPTLQDLADKLDRLAKDLEQTQKWNDRTWDVIKWVGGISAGLAISASIALVGIVIRQLGQ